MNRANIKHIDLSENRCPEPSHFCKNLCSHARMSGLKEGGEAVESDQGEIVKTGHSEAGMLITSRAGEHGFNGGFSAILKTLRKSILRWCLSYLHSQISSWNAILLIKV
jgi:hypothetical protein